MLQASSIDLIVPRRRVALRPSSVTTLQSGQYETSPSSRGFGLESASSPPGRADTALHVGTSVLAQCHGNTGKLQPYLYPISHRNKYKSRQECEELGMITDSAGGGASELACAEDWERPTCIPRPGGAEGKICKRIEHLGTASSRQKGLVGDRPWLKEGKQNTISAWSGAVT
ncbi:unnamed protein product [Clonostachys chloroleuca]|uniref:Uncharacterized protein n=1 Tax=Clonostachys chloroleuca TaxID=1926264 RepID=A0AA35PXU5_9HYPO|nr:unnamed protein product [Clonostachys chloroleuca]